MKSKNIFIISFRWMLKEYAHYSQWTELRKIGGQKIVQLTIVVPIIGAYILFSQQFCALTGDNLFAKNIGLACGADGEPSWKTLCIYYGFIFISIASLWYTVLCPKEIKGNESEFEFEAAMSKYLNYSRVYYMYELLHAMYSSMEGSTKEKYLKHIALLYPNIFGAIADGLKLSISEAKSDSGVMLNLKKFLKTEEKGDFLLAFYIALEFKNRASRYIILFLYALGFLLLAASAIMTIIKVTVVVFAKSPTL